MTKFNKFIIFGKNIISQKEILEVNKTLKSGWIGTGKKVIKFEKEFARYKNTSYSKAVNSCTAALFLSLKALNLKFSDEVIIPALSFVSTANVVLHAGAKPRFVDVDLYTRNIDLNKIENSINKNTKAIIVVHFAGLPVDMKKLMKIVNKYKIKLIEDCAHAIETKYNSQHTGTFGSFGCFSFYPNKNITTGEGGMILTKNKSLLKKINPLVLHGLNKDAWKRFSVTKNINYDVSYPGYKFNMTDIQASIGIHQLSNISEKHRIRKKIWNIYLKELKNLPIILPIDADKISQHGYHLFPIVIPKKNKKNRNKVIDIYFKNNIGVGIHYPAIPNFTYYKKILKFDINKYPITKQIGSNTLSLPLYPSLSNSDLERVIRCTKNIFNG